MTAILLIHLFQNPATETENDLLKIRQEREEVFKIRQEREEEVFKIQQERERKGEDVDVDEVDDDEKEERRTRIWWRREEGEENELGSDEKTKK